MNWYIVAVDLERLGVSVLFFSNSNTTSTPTSITYNLRIPQDKDTYCFQELALGVRYCLGF